MWVLFSAAAFADTIGQLAIHVLDEAEQTVPRPCVKLEGPTLEEARPARGSAEGEVLFVGLAPQHYDIWVTAPGYGQVVLSGVKIAATRKTEVTVSLPLRSNQVNHTLWIDPSRPASPGSLQRLLDVEPKEEADVPLDPDAQRERRRYEQWAARHRRRWERRALRGKAACVAW